MRGVRDVSARAAEARATSKVYADAFVEGFCADQSAEPDAEVTMTVRTLHRAIYEAHLEGADPT